MLKPELYNKTVSILVDAYFKDTLVHGYACACAVGNLVAANCGISFKKGAITATWDSGIVSWDRVHSTAYGSQKIEPINYRDEAKRQIDSTGYTFMETAMIEKAFELADKGETDEDYMFNGLMAVIEVLDEIHQNTDKEITTTSKGRFNKSLQNKILCV